MLSRRTSATLVARDNISNQAETILIVIPLPANQTDPLNTYVATFCIQRNISLVIPAVFDSWPDNIGTGEFQCETCGQTCIRQSIDFDNFPDNGEMFCSNFCANINNSSDK